MEQDGRLNDVFRVMLGFAGVDHIDDVGIFLVHRDFQTGPFFKGLIDHPFAGIHEFFDRDVHLGSEQAMHAGTDLEFPRHETLGMKQAAQVAEHDAHVDAIRAERAATVATGALGPGGVHAHAHELVGDVALLLDDLAQGGLDLVGGNLLGIAPVHAVQKTAVGAESAMGADIQPGFGS